MSLELPALGVAFCVIQAVAVLVFAGLEYAGFVGDEVAV
jgi:hypothetical protein